MSLHEMIKSSVTWGRTETVKFFANEPPDGDAVDKLLSQEFKRLASEQQPPASGKIQLLQAAVQQQRAMEEGRLDQLDGKLQAGYPDPRFGPHEVLVSYLTLALHHSHVRLVA